MIYSLNEIDAHCKKAARGAGFEWGYAEEIGKAVRWLAAYRLPGTEVLAAYLSARDDHPELFCRPAVNSTSKVKARGGGNLCPVLTGAWLCDSNTFDKHSCTDFEFLNFPLLLFPYLVQIAVSMEHALTFEFESTRLQFSRGICSLNNENSLRSRLVEYARLTMHSTPVRGMAAAVTGQKIADVDWQLLNQYASKTYVPATQASRRGAGPAE